jgi:hypothetical protein
MKHQLLLLFLLSVSTSMMAKVKGYPTIFSEYKEEVQQAHPDAQADSILTTNIWKTYYHTADGEYAVAKYKATLSDSIIAGKEYMKVIVENRDTLLYRQEGDKVYMCWDGIHSGRAEFIPLRVILIVAQAVAFGGISCMSTINGLDALLAKPRQLLKIQSVANLKKYRSMALSSILTMTFFISLGMSNKYIILFF